MTEYIVKIGFWLRAYDGFTIDAEMPRAAVRTRSACACGLKRVTGPATLTAATASPSTSRNGEKA